MTASLTEFWGDGDDEADAVPTVEGELQAEQEHVGLTHAHAKAPRIVEMIL